MLKSSCRRLATPCALLLVLATACLDPQGADRGKRLADVPACNAATRGTPHRGNLGTELWTRDASPHVLTGSVHMVQLRVEAGAVVCAASDVLLTTRKLVALGTPDSPIVFMPVDTAPRWGGIEALWEVGEADVTHVRIHRTNGPGIRLRRGTVRSAVVDSACLTVTPCGAIEVHPYATVTVEGAVIRASGSHGIYVGRRSVLRLGRSGAVRRRARWRRSSGVAGAVTYQPVRDTPVTAAHDVESMRVDGLGHHRYQRSGPTSRSDH